MKKLLVSSVALVALAMASPSLAADLPVKAPMPPVVVPVYYSWTGCYVGGNIGAAWRGGDGWRDTTFNRDWGGGDNNGRFIGGGQIGCNYQFDRFVIGAEWDADWTGRRDVNATVFVPGVGTLAATGGASGYVSTIAARFGLAFDRVLLYGKAGFGFVGAEGDLTIANLTTGNAFVLSGGGSRSGWVIGAGVEWGITEAWTAKLEFDYLGRSGNTFTVPAGVPFFAGDTFTTGNRNISMVKLGVNYRFNWGAPAPVRAAY